MRKPRNEYLLHYCILDFGNRKKIIYHSEGYIIPTKEKLNFYFGNYNLNNAFKSYTIIDYNKLKVNELHLLKSDLELNRDFYKIDTLKNKPIYMGHFLVEKNDLEDKPFISDSEILGIDFDESRIHFSKSVTEKIYNSIPEWKKKSIFGKQFAMCHNGKIILSGYLIGSMSSYWSNTYQIYYERSPENKRNNGLRSISFLISDSLNFEKNNLMKNEELYNAFKNRLINDAE